MKTQIFTVTEQELVQHKWVFQLVLRVLKEKGAPIKGFFILKLDCINYTWRHWQDKESGAMVFEVTSKEPESELPEVDV